MRDVGGAVAADPRGRTADSRRDSEVVSSESRSASTMSGGGVICSA